MRARYSFVPRDVSFFFSDHLCLALVAAPTGRPRTGKTKGAIALAAPWGVLPLRLSGDHATKTRVGVGTRQWQAHFCCIVRVGSVPGPLAIASPCSFFFGLCLLCVVKAEEGTIRLPFVFFCEIASEVIVAHLRPHCAARARNRHQATQHATIALSRPTARPGEKRKRRHHQGKRTPFLLAHRRGVLLLAPSTPLPPSKKERLTPRERLF